MAAYAIQFRRGTTTQHNSFTGLLGEVTVDTDKKTLVVHDGSTTGGFPLMREGAASTSSTGSFTSNVAVGGTLAVTSTASFSDDVTITGDLGMTGHIIPSANITYDLGSTSMMWRDIYVGPGSLYVNGKKVIEDNAGTINITTDINQNLKVETTGTGTLQLSSAAGISVNGEVNALTGDLQFGDHLDMNSNRIKEVSAPVDGADAANKTYVDSAISSGLSGGTLAVDATTGDFSGNVTVGGSLTVTGTVTTVNSETIELADNILLLNSNALGNASQSGGIEVERGDDLNVQLLWDETNDRWSVGAEDMYAATFIGDLTGDVTGTVSSISNHDTDDLAEGSNMYWTTARGNTNFDANLAASDTDDLAEGSNLYFTNERVANAMNDGSSVTALDTGNFAVSSSGASFDVDINITNGSSNVLVVNSSTGATTIAGPTIINNTFNAGDDVSFEGDNTFNISNSSSNNVFAIDVANTTFAIDLDMTVNNSATFNNDVVIEGNNNFTVNDNSSNTIFDIDVANNTTVIGGATTVNNDFAITNSSSTNVFDVDVTANTFDVALDLTVNNSATFKNDFSVTNSSSTNVFDIDVANTTLDIDLDMTVNNSATFKNDFSVTNSSSTNVFDIDVANTTLDIDLDMTVNNSATFNNNIAINNSSSTTLVDIDVANATYDIDMDLTVNNATTVNNNFTVNNTSSSSVFDIDVANTTLDIDLDVTLNNEVTINNTLVLNNGLTLGTSAEGTVDARVRAVNLADEMATEAYVDAAVAGKDELSELSGSTDDVAEGSTNLYYTDARADARIAAADTDDLSEGSTNLYHTTARARAAISASGSLSYNSTTGEMSFTMPAQNTTAITEGDNLYYTDARADARVANATGVNLDISNQDTDELSEGSSNLYFTDARALAAAKAGMSMTHSGVYVVTASDNTGNSGSAHAITAATLGFNVAGKEFYQVFLNRQLLRPTEYTVNSSNGTITFSADVIATDDEIEAVIYG